MNNTVVFIDYSKEAFERLPSTLGRLLKGVDWYFWNTTGFSVVRSNGKKIKFSEFYKNILKNSHLIITGHRPWDLMMAHIWNSSVFKVFYIQHGIYVKKMERQNFGLNLPVARLMVIILPMIYFLFKRPSLLLNLGRSRWDLSKTAEIRKIAPKTAYDKCYVYNNKWVEFHKQIFGDNNVKSVGFFDLGKSVFISKKQQGRIVYVMQSLVEDGRAKMDYLGEVKIKLEKLKKDNNISIFFKKHPRTNDTCLSFMSEFAEQTKTLNTNDVLIGHYSSILDQAYEKGVKCFVMRLSAHQIPLEYIKAFPDYGQINLEELNKQTCSEGDVPKKGNNTGLEYISNDICRQLQVYTVNV